MTSTLLLIVLALVLLGAVACSTTERGEGEECFASAECAAGLLCDFGAAVPVCAPQQTARPAPPDPGPLPDAGQTEVDAPPQPPPDAPVAMPDAAPADAAPDAAAL